MSTAAHDISANALAVILAGGQGSRLGALTRRQCKPALPFGGVYRNIDFSLSNCANSGVRTIGVATQYLPESLSRHVRQVWQTTRSGPDPAVALWPSQARPFASDYRGTADAVLRNWHHIERAAPRLVLILAGDHIYKMDYRKLLSHHLRVRADVTVGCVEVPLTEASRFGVMAVDANTRVVRFVEKPVTPEAAPGRKHHALVSMGIYVFGMKFLGQILATDRDASGSKHDFGLDILPRIIHRARVHAYAFTRGDPVGCGYWRDVGTLTDYWRAHMDLLKPTPPLILNDELWPLRAGGFRPSICVQKMLIRPNGTRISNSLVASDSQLLGATVTRSVVSPDVRIGYGATVSDSVILPGAVIGRNSQLCGVIVDTNCQVPEGTVLGQLHQANEELERSWVPLLLTAEDFQKQENLAVTQSSVEAASVA